MNSAASHSVQSKNSLQVRLRKNRPTTGKQSSIQGDLINDRILKESYSLEERGKFLWASRLASSKSTSNPISHASQEDHKSLVFSSRVKDAVRSSHRSYDFSNLIRKLEMNPIKKRSPIELYDGVQRKLEEKRISRSFDLRDNNQIKKSVDKSFNNPWLYQQKTRLNPTNFHQPYHRPTGRNNFLQLSTLNKQYQHTYDLSIPGKFTNLNPPRIFKGMGYQRSAIFD